MSTNWSHQKALLVLLSTVYPGFGEEILQLLMRQLLNGSSLPPRLLTKSGSVNTGRLRELWCTNGQAGRRAGRLMTPARGSVHTATTLAASWSASCFLAGLQRTELTLLRRKLCQILAFEDFGKLLFQGKKVANWDFS